MRLEFKPAEAAQVDFGAGPTITDAHTGEIHKTWFFVMTLRWSQHQYAEFVRDQSVDTWLLCHRHAFEWFNGVVGRVIIDNPKCAIVRACIYEPKVQRAYAQCAEGYSFKIDLCPPRDPAKKGIVESGVKYVKSSLLPLREFRNLDDAGRCPNGVGGLIYEAKHDDWRPLQVDDLVLRVEAILADHPSLGHRVRLSSSRDLWGLTQIMIDYTTGPRDLNGQPTG